MPTLAHKRERRVLRKLDLSPEVQRALEWFYNNITDVFRPVRDSLVDALESGDIDPAKPLTLQSRILQIVRGHRADVLVIFEDGTERGANAGVELARRRYPIEISYDLAPDRVLREFSRWSDAAVDNSMQTLTRDVAHLVRGAHEEGLSIPDIASQVDGLFENRYIEGWKAEQIARTATIPSSNAGSHATYIDAPGVVGEEWLATVTDNRTRPSHREADEQVVAPGTRFIVGGHTARFPGDPTLPLDELINCRCSSLPIFPEQLTESEMATLRSGGRLNT